MTTGAISRAKLQLDHHHQQTNIQFFTGRMPFLSPNQQCQSTEWNATSWTLIEWLFCLTVSLPMHFSDPERLLQREEIVQGECVKNTERSKIVLSPTKANSADAQLHILLCELTYYAALLPRRGPHNASHSVCPSVCLSVRPSRYHYRASRRAT